MTFVTAQAIYTSQRDVQYNVVFRLGSAPDSPVRDLTGATVEIVFRDPNGVVVRRAGVIIGAATNGRAGYLDAPGDHNAVPGVNRYWGTYTLGATGPVPSTQLEYTVAAEGDE